MLFGKTFLATSAKNFLLILPILLLFTTGFAQDESKKRKKVYFTLGPELAVPVGDFSQKSAFGIGGSALLEVKASQPVGITFGLCYIHYFPKNKPVYSGVATDQLAALLGARYYFNKHFFASGQAGFSIHQNEFVEIDGSVVIAPGLGFKYGVLDATLKYMTANREYSTLSNISLRLGIEF